MTARTGIHSVRSNPGEETSVPVSGHSEPHDSSPPPARDSSSGVRSTTAPDFRAVYDQHAKFVWFTMQRLGIRHRDLDDLCHDAFVVVHEKLAGYTDRASIRSWLFAICARLAANYRRKAPVRLERTIASFDEVQPAAPSAPESGSPERLALRQEALVRAQAILEKMQPIQRVVFMMFEVEGMGCEEIATELGVPVGTVYSRLHAARKSFHREALRSRTLTSRGPHG
jgi:RNA polymerase sigma-70 factor (ECF subfamily)